MVMYNSVNSINLFSIDLYNYTVDCNLVRFDARLEELQIR